MSICTLNRVLVLCARLLFSPCAREQRNFYKFFFTHISRSVPWAWFRFGFSGFRTKTWICRKYSNPVQFCASQVYARYTHKVSFFYLLFIIINIISSFNDKRRREKNTTQNIHNKIISNSVSLTHLHVDFTQFFSSLLSSLFRSIYELQCAVFNLVIWYSNWLCVI